MYDKMWTSIFCFHNTARPPLRPILPTTKQLSNLVALLIQSIFTFEHLVSIRKTKWGHLAQTSQFRALIVREFSSPRHIQLRQIISLGKAGTQPLPQVWSFWKGSQSSSTYLAHQLEQTRGQKKSSLWIEHNLIHLNVGLLALDVPFFSIWYYIFVVLVQVLAIEYQ